MMNRRTDGRGEFDKETEAPQEELILGIHSIAAALKNPERNWLELLMTEDFYKKIKTMVPASLMKSTKIRHLETHDFQQQAQKLFRQLGFDFQRIPAGGLLLARPLRQYQSITELVMERKAPKRRVIVALDQVTDIHNAGAILRTCAFYGVDALLIPTGHSFTVTPSFSRIASGGLESVPIIRCASLASAMLKVQEKFKARLIGFSEEATEEWIGQKSEISSSTETDHKSDMAVLVFGAEETGLSHAVERVLSNHYKLSPNNSQLQEQVINSLNVSISVAVALDRFYKDTL